MGRVSGNGVRPAVIEARGQRPRVLALVELVNLCEGRQVI
jgi:hypothetical protein